MALPLPSPFSGDPLPGRLVLDHAVAGGSSTAATRPERCLRGDRAAAVGVAERLPQRGCWLQQSNRIKTRIVVMPFIPRRAMTVSSPAVEAGGVDPVHRRCRPASRCWRIGNAEPAEPIGNCRSCLNHRNSAD